MRLPWKQTRPRPKVLQQKRLDTEELNHIEAAVQDMLSAKVIYRNDAKDVVISPVYTVPKKGSEKRRFVMNLRWINRHLRTEHFKMTTMKDVKGMISRNAFMTKLDLKDCYWQVPVCKEDQR